MNYFYFKKKAVIHDRGRREKGKSTRTTEKKEGKYQLLKYVLHLENEYLIVRLETPFICLQTLFNVFT
jgi:hypothetical protein